MDTNRSIFRSARSFFAGTLLSRFSGMSRDIAMAICFGSAPEIAAFMVAYRFANLFRRLLGEGNLQAGFIPHFEAIKAESPERAASFYRDVSYSFGLLLIAVVLFLELLLWGSFYFVSPDWGEIVELSMWMVPGLFFICLYALNSSLLQCQKSYFLPSVAPVVFNCVWIAAVFLVWHLPREEAVRFLAIAVIFAFAGQWLATAFQEKRLLAKPANSVKLFSREARALLKPLSLGIIGIGAVQINSALDTIFARLADPEGPAFLWYAIRIQQLPLALFGVALSGALLPPLSRAIQRGDGEHYKRLLQTAFRISAALMIVCTFGIFALGGVGINFLYGHGDFTPHDVEQTLYCLWGYGVGLLPAVFILLLASGFYAQKNYRTPTAASLISVAANLFFNALFVFGFGWGAVSIAIATSLSSLLNLFVLSRGLQLFNASFRAFVLKMSFCCALPTSILLAMGTTEFPRSIGVQLFQLSLFTLFYLGIFSLLAWQFKLTDVFELFRKKRAEGLLQ